jgi:hypothetical protein
MKRKFVRSALVLGCGMFAAAICNVQALTIGDANELGFIANGIPSGANDVTAYVNQLIEMSPGATTTALGQTFTRSTHIFSPLDPAVLVSRVTYGGLIEPTVTIHLETGFEYLLAKYDGPNFGTEVWYVGGLSGDITIPSHAENNDQFGLSGTSLFTELAVPPSAVPDSGKTALLLGSAIMILGLVSRKLAKC